MTIRTSHNPDACHCCGMVKRIFAQRTCQGDHRRESPMNLPSPSSLWGARWCAAMIRCTWEGSQFLPSCWAFKQRVPLLQRVPPGSSPWWGITSAPLAATPHVTLHCHSAADGFFRVRHSYAYLGTQSWRTMAGILLPDISNRCLCIVNPLNIHVFTFWKRIASAKNVVYK